MWKQALFSFLSASVLYSLGMFWLMKCIDDRSIANLGVPLVDAPFFFEMMSMALILAFGQTMVFALMFLKAREAIEAIWSAHLASRITTEV